jgi:glyoxylase-like metal-dependent hydrolase (beta-lactamase superfamily II)
MNKLLLVFSFGLFMPCMAGARNRNYLYECWLKQVQPIGHSYIHFSYVESEYLMAHLFRPWQAYHSADTGVIWCNEDKFLKADTSAKWGSRYYSKMQLSISDSTLLILRYGNKNFSKVTWGEFEDGPLEEARYSPVLLLNYFHEHEAATESKSNNEYAIYTLLINKAFVSLFISKKDALLEKVTRLNSDDLYGDVTTTINYCAFTTANNLYYPSLINIDKINGKLTDTVMLLTATITDRANSLLDKPADYKITGEKAVIPDISVEKYNEHIHFITLKHTNGRSMIVEFDSFLVLAEAPLNSGNGELIINEARKIAPGKPIKYFVFGHYHPDYIGGIRAFIHNSATILCTKDDVSYVNYLAGAPHSLQPDSLELYPRPLKIEEVYDCKTISDGKYEMDVCFIGPKSGHTDDYLVYYFPQAKMLFEGDLVSIAEKSPITKAGKRQAGLYHAIKDLNLDVITIEQSWPAANYGIKAEIPFSDMEESMSVK